MYKRQCSDRSCKINSCISWLAQLKYFAESGLKVHSKQVKFYKISCNNKMSVAVPIVRSNSQALQLMEEGKKKDWLQSRSERSDEPLFVNDSFNHLDHYKHLSERLRSFDNPDWPSGVPVTTEELARAGWFYVGRDDRGQCPWCGGCVFNWVPGDSALGEHRRHFPHCDFVCDYMAKAFAHISKCSGRCTGAEEQKIILAKNSVSEMGFADEIIEEASRVLLHGGKRSAL